MSLLVHCGIAESRMGQSFAISRYFQIPVEEDADQGRVPDDGHRHDRHDTANG
jgi:hypothetical protein